ncbi:MAG: divalent metal cation transporter [Cellulomonas sp.]|nr:divalent metal cation transporter [Cellulomonas sp.]
MEPSKPRLLKVLGPGLITGASDDDPSGIATYSQAGAQFGFSITWTLLLTLPLMAVIQEIAGRIGRASGLGLAGVISKNFPAWVMQTIVFLLFFANIINIGADLGAMGDAVKLIIGGPSTIYVVIFGFSCVLMQVFMKYKRYVSVLKWLTISLFAYFGTVPAVNVPWSEALRGLVIPTFNPDPQFWTVVVAIDSPFTSLNAGVPEGRTGGSTLVRGLAQDEFVGLDDAGSPVPDAAFGTVEKLSDSPLTVRYTLASGARWSDGVPVSPADLLLDWAARSGATVSEVHAATGATRAAVMTTAALASRRARVTTPCGRAPPAARPAARDAPAASPGWAGAPRR